jgi:photosystem II stability/assembly factor-like uncharacterized protein
MTDKSTTQIFASGGHWVSGSGQRSAGGLFRRYAGDDGSLYRSDDVGCTWRRFDHGVKARATMMAVTAHPRDAARVYCVSRCGQVFGTEDTGASWREYPLPEGVQDVYTVACA